MNCIVAQLVLTLITTISRIRVSMELISYKCLFVLSTSLATQSQDPLSSPDRLFAFIPLPPQPRPNTPPIQPLLLVARSPGPATEHNLAAGPTPRSPALGQKTAENSDEIIWQRMLVHSAADQWSNMFMLVTSHQSTS